MSDEMNDLGAISWNVAPPDSTSRPMMTHPGPLPKPAEEARPFESGPWWRYYEGPRLAAGGENPGWSAQDTSTGSHAQPGDED